MTKQEIAAVKAYLYSIKRTEIAIINLTRALEDLDTRMQSPPTWMSNPEAVGVYGASNESRQETWVMFQEAYPERRAFLNDKLHEKRRKVEEYETTLAAMVQEGNWGPLAVQIVKYKYNMRVSPDSAIYLYHLFCTKETFYRLHRRALQFFCDALPHRFEK
jgi:hypothetical protein